MATSVSELIRKRGKAKGDVTKIGNALERVSATPIDDWDSTMLHKQGDAMERLYKTFLAHNESIIEAVGEAEAEKHEDELAEQQLIIASIRKKLKGMNCCLEARDLLGKLLASLDELRHDTMGGYSAFTDPAYARVGELFREFTEMRSQWYVRRNSELTEGHHKAQTDWLTLRQLKEAAIVPTRAATVDAATAKDVQVMQPSLALALPTFDGTVLGWRDFWELFSSIMDNEKHLKDPVKCAHLIRAMGTDDARENAELAVSFADTYLGATEKLKKTYECNRVLHTFYFKEYFQQDIIQPKKKDYVKFLKRTEKALRGFEQVKGNTLGQVMTTYAESIMAPALSTQWMKFTERYDEPPPLKELTLFLEKQIRATRDEPISRKEVSTSSTSSTSSPHPARRHGSAPKQGSRLVLQNQTVEPDKCPLCGYNHSLYTCAQFQGQTPHQRQELAKSARLCYNCLSSRHKSDECRSKGRCRTCSRKHHTLLHFQRSSSSGDGDGESATVNLVSSQSSDTDESEYILPSTAMVLARAKGPQLSGRAQLDSGASISMITKRMVNGIQAPRIPNSAIRIMSVGGVVKSSHRVKVALVGRNDELITIYPQVVDHIPSSPSKANVSKIFGMPFLDELSLADPGYTSAARIDVLLSMGASNSCCKEGRRFSPSRQLKAEETIFGWTVGGHDTQENQESEKELVCLQMTTEDQGLGDLLERFWEVTQFSAEENLHTSEERLAVEHFISTCQRDPDGRFRVSLPRKPHHLALGSSREMAVKRYLAVERSLKRRGCWDAFKTALNDYINSEHAQRVPAQDLRKSCEQTFYMPMHPVFKYSSSTTKLRAVCDASAQTSNGISLNDTLLSGPSLYPLLTTVLNNFRVHAIGMTSDISRMFREIGLNAEETDYHRFVHRDDDDNICDWKMTRLAFGVKSSPYLATQVLRQLAKEYREEFPRAADIVVNNFYVDDCLAGAENVEEAKLLREELNALFGKARMSLRKWRSSSAELLATIPKDLKETTDLRITATPGECTKALGLHWSTVKDSLHIATPDVNIDEPATKRRIASVIARIFDVLGWYTPAILPAKILLQEVWGLQLGWDEKIPYELQQRWIAWLVDLPCITSHPTPRHFGLKTGVIRTRQLHGFSDASKSAFGGVIYLRTMYEDRRVAIDLVASKAKISPVKADTIPRLELSGALVLAQLLRSVADDLKIPEDDLYAWADSSAVLGWINKPPLSMPVFVANRVVKITELISPKQWRYVQTKLNPSDILSRGMPTKDLLMSTLWWKGPPWLVLDPKRWPRRPDINMERELSEDPPTILSVSTVPEEFGQNISSFERLERTVGWIWRFFLKSKGKFTEKLMPYLSIPELRNARTVLLRHSQRCTYDKECRILERGKTLPNGNSLASLAPYVDQERLLRVGGRLQRSALAHEAAHPLILSPHSHAVKLLTRQTHQLLLHAGTSTVMATMAQTYHVPRLKPLLKRMSKNCVVCQRAYARTTTQMMGELPALRVQPGRAFAAIGLDYAGPVFTKRGHPRRPTLIKTYICIFVCFSTRAVHMEVVSDLSTAAFLAALSRFACRRGRPADVYSDNGTNFRGAQAELKELYDLLRTENSQATVTREAANMGINWHFSPARAPHFGGLWEAAVKAMKMLIRKTVGDRALTYEELTTLVTQAEAILNSRPLVRLDSTADDGVAPLTSGHFLTGGPLYALPTRPDLTSELPLLRNWNLVQRMVHDLWTRWKEEYLVYLQRRSKWLQPGREMCVGDVVLMKDASAFQRTWPLARVTKVYPGKDGHTRVVDVFTQGKTFRRPITRLALLLEEEIEPPSRGENVRADDDEQEGVLDAPAQIQDDQQEVTTDTPVSPPQGGQTEN